MFKESTSAEKTPIGGRSVARAAIAREPKGAWTTRGRREGDADYRSGKRELHCVFYLILKRVFVDERDITDIIAKVEATSWRLRGKIRVRDLAAMYRLGQLRHLQMLKEKKAWMREAGFDYIETSAEMDARYCRTNLVSEPFFYRKIFNPRCPHTPDKFTLEMRVDFE